MSTEVVALDQEIATIEQTMRGDFAAYQADRSMQDRYLSLLRTRESGKAPAASSHPRDVERRELERMMADQNGPYWKGPQAAQHQARYRQLIEKDLGPAPTSDSNAPLLTIPRGASEADLEAMRVAGDILRHMPSDTHASFNAITTNAITTNAITTNAITTNSLTTNSLTTNSVGEQGSAQGTSTLSIQSIELPASAR